MISIQPRLYTKSQNVAGNNNAMSHKSIMMGDVPMQNKADSVSFGRSCPLGYNYKNVFQEFKKNNVKFEGGTPEEVFKKLHSAVTDKLSNMKAQEDEKDAQREATNFFFGIFHAQEGRDYNVRTEFPAADKFVSIASGFIRKVGLEPLAEPRLAVSSYILNDLKMQKSTSFFSLNETDHLISILSSIQENLINNGLVSIKNLK